MSRIKAGNRPVVYEDGLQTRDFVSVHDIAKANVMADDTVRLDTLTNVCSFSPSISRPAEIARCWSFREVIMPPRKVIHNTRWAVYSAPPWIPDLKKVRMTISTTGTIANRSKTPDAAIFSVFIRVNPFIL